MNGRDSLDDIGCEQAQIAANARIFLLFEVMTGFEREAASGALFFDGFLVEIDENAVKQFDECRKRDEAGCVAMCRSCRRIAGFGFGFGFLCFGFGRFGFWGFGRLGFLLSREFLAVGAFCGASAARIFA